MCIVPTLHNFATSKSTKFYDDLQDSKFALFTRTIKSFISKINFDNRWGDVLYETLQLQKRANFKLPKFSQYQSKLEINETLILEVLGNVLKTLRVFLIGSTSPKKNKTLKKFDN